MAQSRQVQDRIFRMPPVMNETSQSTPTFQFSPMSLSSNISKNSNVIQSSVEENTEQMQSTVLYGRLKQEVGKISKWKLHTEIEIKQKDKKIQDSTQTIDSLRKSILELQIQNENLSLKLQDEIDNRDEIVQRIAATRDMCNLLKDYATKVEDRLQKCETEKTELKYLEKEHFNQFEELSSEFENLSITASETCNKIRNELEQVKEEKQKSEVELGNKLSETSEELEEMKKICDNKVSEIESLSQHLDISQQGLLEMKNEYGSLQKVLSESESSSFERERRITEMSIEMDALKENFQREIDDRQTEIANLRQTLEKQTGEINNLHETMKQIQDNLCKCEGSLTEKNSQLEDWSKQITVLMKQITENEEDLQKTKQELNETLDREKQSYEKIDSVNKELQRCRDDNENTLIMLKDEEKEKEAIKKTCDNHKREILKLESAMELGKQREEKLNSEIETLQEEVENQRAQLKGMEENAKLHGEEVVSKMEAEITNARSLQKDLDKKTKTLADVQEKLKNSKADLTAKNKQLKELDKELASCKKTIETVTAEKEAAAEEHENNSKLIGSMLDKCRSANEAIIMEQQNEIEGIKKSLQNEKEKTKNLEKLKKECEALKNQLEKAEKGKEQKLSKLRNELEKIQSTLNSKEDELMQQQDLVEEYKQKEKEWRNKAATSEGIMKELQQSEDELKAKDKNEKEMEKDIENLKEELQQLKIELSENGKKLQEHKAFEDDYNKVKTELEQVRSELVEKEKKLKEVLLIDRNRKEPEKEKENIPKSSDDEMIHLNEREKNAHLLKTPQRSQLTKTPLSALKTPNSILKKRRVFFASDDDDSSSCDLMEVDFDELESSSKKSGVIKLKQSPKVPTRTPPRTPALSKIQQKRLNMNSNSGDLNAIQEESLFAESNMKDESRVKRSYAPYTPKSQVSRVQPKVGTDAVSGEMQQFKILFPDKAKDSSLLGEPKAKKRASEEVRPNIRKTPNKSPGRFFKSQRTERKSKKSSKEDDKALDWMDSVFDFGPED